MTDITKAQFPNRANVAGEQTFSYAELLAQLMIDLGGVSGTEGELVSFDIANAIQNVPKGATGNVLTANAIGIPTFQVGGGGGATNIGLGALVTGGAQVIPNSAFTVVDFSVGGATVEYDDFGMFDGASRFDIPIADTISRAWFFCHAFWTSNATGQRTIISRLDGSSYPGGFQISQVASANAVFQAGYATAVKVVPGTSFFQMGVIQNSGGPLTLTSCNASVIVARDTG